MNQDFKFIQRKKCFFYLVNILLFTALLFNTNLLFNKYNPNLRLYLIKNHSLSEETQKVLSQITDPIDIVVPFNKNNGNELFKNIHQELSTLLREYLYLGNISKKDTLHVHYVDLKSTDKKNTFLRKKYKLINEGIISISSEKAKRNISIDDLYEANIDKRRFFAGEKIITSAIHDILAKKIPKVYFIYGHGELNLDDLSANGMSSAKNYISTQNINLVELDLKRNSNIPNDAELVIIPAPIDAFDKNEIQKLREYIKIQKGRVILFLKPNSNHNLSEFLKEWQILIRNDITILEKDPDFLSNNRMIIRKFAKHPISNTFIEQKRLLNFGNTLPVNIDYGQKENPRLKTKLLFFTSEKSTGKTLTSNYSLKGPISIGAISEEYISNDIQLPVGKVTVIGSSDFLTNEFFMSQGNYLLFKNLINYNLNRNDLLPISAIPPKFIKIVISDKAERSINIFILILSLIPAFMAILIYFKRRS